MSDPFAPRLTSRAAPSAGATLWAFARGLVGTVLRVVLAVAAFLLMLGALLVGALLALGLVAWALLRGRRPAVGVFKSTLHRARRPMGPMGSSSWQGRSPGQVIDVEVREVPDTDPPARQP
ncbi:MAG: hypothetical protein Q8R98_23965 [Rubrivivax sp.]|nr:hypothetical protein [Rubrivivax sp.]MDP3225580.1 hypothetical protein [Rubrivivax sp.]MDP3614909.1 hypothetical protein [Rubrivivax sp.]